MTDSNGNKTLEYGSFEIIMDPAQGNTHEIPSMEIYDHDGKPILVEDANGNKVNYTLNLQDTYVEVNLYGGTVYGDIYGGGYGYSNQFTQNQFQWAPRRELYDGRYRCLAGTLYGNATINLLPNPYGDAPVTVYGNIYGGGAGALEFLTNKLDNNDKTADIIEYEKGLRTYGGTTYDFNHLAQVFGDVSINIEDGVVMGGVYNNKERGNVFGGGMGKNGFPSMGNIYGNCSVTISGGEIQGNVYGGSAYSDIQKYSLTRMVDEKTFNTNYDQGGNTSVNISGGTFGNCIFGGGLGCLAGDNQVETSSNIEGNTSVIITGGRFSSEAYTYYYDADGNQLTDTDGNPVRTQNNFNIYGGGYINGVIDGNAEVMIKTGLLYDEESLGDGWTFEKAWNDITYRRFCVYGGGWGENTLVEGNANIRLDIPEDGKVAPTDQAITELVPGQTFFDVAGGGYAGDVGYWVDEHNVKSLNTPAAERVPDTFAKYQNGNLLVTVSGYPFVRKVVGGGFYSQCNNADTYIFGGSIQEVYGGALMGYVHKNARLYIGQPNTNMNEWELTRYNFSRHTNLSDEELASVNADRRENAYKRNHSLFIVGNVYGGNDVKGVVGSTKWYDKYLPDYSDDEIAKINAGGTTKFGMESSDDEPLFCSDVEAVDTKGVTMTINGGTICGNVYGVGNGHYRGYYVPGWARYGDGPARQYRKALLPGKTHADYKVNADGTDNADQVYGNVYRCRPMTGKVTIHISGNGLDDQGRMDSVSIRGNVYGGGRACTLGQWNTALPYEDPRRLTKGGFLHINMGSNVNIGGSVYMGSEGTEFATAHEVPSDIDLSTFDGSTTEELDKLGDVAYDHWYYDATDKYYKPGFPAADQVGGNIGIYGEHMYRAYFKNIEMQGDVEITFYNDPFEKDANGYVKTHDTDGDEYFVRRRWVPGEMAISDYDATNVTINSFYGGGACGSMTNNTQMYWNYDKNSIISDPDNQGTDNVEKYGAIYRYILPPGVTILDRIVGGSENATNRYYGYTDDTFTKLRTSADSSPIYEFEGGMVTQSTYTYYLLAYNDQKGQNIHDVKPEVYLKDTYDENDTDPNYTLSDGTLIYPKYYETGLKTVPNALYLLNPRFAIAVAKGQNGATDTGYCGAREERSDKTVLKLTVANQFDPQEGEHDYLGSVEDPTEHYYHFGGVIYGGCYDSGVTQGDVMVSVLSNTIGRHLSEKDPTTFGDISTLEHNIGRVFGGGYGADSRVDGDTYVNLMHNFVGMNVFGGGCQGDVNGMTHIKYVGDEANSFVFGAIYGGGLYGNVGVKLGSNNPDHDPTPIATEVRLFSGNVDKVYGGACLGDLYGRTHVELCDEVYGKLEYFNYELLLKYMDVDDWGGARLIAGTVFGGNDVSGNIYPQPTAGEALNKDEVENNNAKPDYGLNEYSTYVKVHEIVQQPTQGPSSAPALSEEVNPGKESPGASNGYNGFPLIGDLYGGSNGSYGSHSGLDYYEGGTYRLASGLGNYVIEFDLAPDPIENYTGFQVPHVEKAYLDIQGGTLINVYGGGDKATITGETNLNVNYSPTDSIMRARAGFAGSDALLRIWNTFHLSDEEQIEEVTTTTGTGDDTTTIFNYHIYRIFGGNDNADMAIQPTWNLVSGYLGSVYSGGNFGKMTYCEDTKNTLTYTDANGDPQNQYTDSNGKAWDVPELKALKLQINSPTLHADAVFGGGRVGDIEPALATTLKSLFTGMTEEDAKTLATNYLTYNPNFYGATLEINDGVVDHVYGGNDVSGTVYQGSRVKITGAISGDVYCAGNGNYRYQYDYTNNTDGAKIAEAYDSENYGGRYFILPMRTEKDGSEYVYGGSTNPTPTQILQAINAYRPNVERTYLTIEGTGPEYGKDSEGKDIVTKEAVQAFVRGNVYCGGNSSTVNHSDATDTNGDIKFEIGSYVVLNGVFLGSNGESLVDPEMMEVTERLNGIDLTEACDLEDYPALLDLYMQAVEITGLPKDFNLSPTLTEAYIGDFYVGGNNGSMLTDKTIGLTFPYNLVIYNRIVGGSNSANVTYRGTTHIGGLTTPLSTDYTDKVYLQVRSQFKPLKIKYVDDVDNRSISLVPDLDYDGSNIYFPEGKCSIFGGCYNSGRTVGNIHIDLYSDMVKEWDTSSFSDYIEDLKQEATNMGFDKIDWANIDVDALLSKDRVIVNGIDQLQRRSFALIGGGYGSATEVRGDIKLHMLPGKLHPDFSASNGDDETPSAATIFGGSQQGSVIGNTEIAVRDGMVLSNLYGGSEAAPMYGSTQILIGWPQYYICKETGHYQLTRTDDLSKAQNWKNSDDPKKKDAILHDIWLREGEYVSVNLYKTLTATTQEYITDFTGNIADYFTFKDDDTPQEYAGHYSSDYVTLNPINWDDIDIYIGNGRSRKNNRQEEYFAHGNVYGGGFITSTSTTSLAGEFTVCKFTEDNCLDPADVGYGGNSSIMVWDNVENRNPKNTDTALYDEYDFEGTGATKGSGAVIRDHITIGTGHYVEATVSKGMDIMGKYLFEPDDAEGRAYLEVTSGNKYASYDKYVYNEKTHEYTKDENGTYVRGNYVHQSSHILTNDDYYDSKGNVLSDGLGYETFYEIESDGGIYGGGRKVYVEGFRNCDLAYYGYADYCPQYPKLLNTAQRLDLFTVTDCCCFFEGASDFSTTTVDATSYSLTRIGELKMISSIPWTSILDPGTRQTTGLYNTEHLTKRSRNYIAFFHDVLYVAALTSNEDFTNPYRGANGKFYYTGDYALETYDEDGNLVTDTRAHNRSDVPDGSDYVDLPTYEAADAPLATGSFSYMEYKKNRIENYYANRNKSQTGNDASIKALTTLEFNQRNVATAANMIGINNGYTLKIQGLGNNPSTSNNEIYYGPVTGVFEVKLMTLATDEGGGYIYALNQHDDPNHFLETTGNFVFPGAAYNIGKKEYNYIYDDCFPMGEGWEEYYGWDTSDVNFKTKSMGPRGISYSSTGQSRASVVTVDTDHGDCNELEEVHYWYVNGSNYYFNVTLTGVTYNNPRSFTLSNNDLIYLYGVPEFPDVDLVEVYWEPISKDGYSSDLQDLTKDEDSNYVKDYKLYLSVDKNSGDVHDGNMKEEDCLGYMAMLPRANYPNLEGGTPLDVLATSTGEISGQYKSTVTDNKPLLGITLCDSVNNAGSNYYQNHLSEDEHVRIVLKAKTADSSTYSFQYTINLTIRYILGPTIKGVPKIENCALPGEYIYANADDIVVEIADNLAVTERNWYVANANIYNHDENRIENGVKTINSNTGIGDNIECITDQIINGDMNQVHIPAYLYRDGWDVVYEIVANSIPFYRTPYSTSVTDEEVTLALDDTQDTEAPVTPETPVTTEDTEIKHLVVHNYHRMKPYDGTSRNDDGTVKLEDLRLTAGARIYIENQPDFEYFFHWLADSCKLVSDGRTNPRVVASGERINPEYGDSLFVYLMTDVKMPDASKIPDVSTLTFRGTFHGNGHSIDLGENHKQFLGNNEGHFYNTGFITSRSDVNVFCANSSTNGKGITSCFLYNESKDATLGRLVALDSNGNSANGNIYNSFRTSSQASTTEVDNLWQATKDDFEYGKVAYNLNHFYLKKRYNLATNSADGDVVEPVNAYYRDGNYRFAEYSAVYDADKPWVLRSDSVPNYHAIKGERISHHHGDYVDNTRWNETAKEYQPNFPQDFIFFGQDLAYRSSEDQWPHAIAQTKRVYRASGFYGSKLDQGFHFNTDAAAVQSTLTAIDFAGYRDQLTDGDGRMGTTNDYGLDASVKYYTDYNCASVDRNIWYAPALDLPDKLESFTTSTYEQTSAPALGENDYVTRNLLVYRPAGMDVFNRYIDTSVKAIDIYYHVIDGFSTSTDSEGTVTTAAGTANTDLFQLVDMEDFNCPIEFGINQTVWYRRKPEVFSSGSNAWEGLCLPFTVRTVYGSVAEMNSPLNHGEMTHFYGYDNATLQKNGLDVKADSHEYWLRKFIGVTTDNDKTFAIFTRPASTEDTNEAEETRNYHYSNTYFSTLYGDSYWKEHDVIQAPGYTEKGIDFTDYPMITAQYPYIISFPGKRYYEFDCSGEFYAMKTSSVVEAQTITYAWNKADVPSTDPVTEQTRTILVSDDNSPIAFKHDDYEHLGTYMHYKANTNPKDVVIDTDPTANSSTFVWAKDTDTPIVYPFRTYLRKPDSGSKTIYIASRGIDSIGEGDDEEDGDSQESNILFSIESNELVIDNPHDVDFEFGLYDLNGRYLRSVTAQPGVTRVASLSPGYYLISTFKFRIN
ncbi:MAG: hypothetical protein LUD17_03260 [Bacteroidales bacterium]|nr:hypothetical protein [Bacteroidales bacterium]